MKLVNKMEELEVNAIINPDNNEITITGLKDNIVLNYADDIDFTELISKLTELIDEDKVINFSCSEADDEKEKLILNTINQIFEEYNNCLKTEDIIEEI